MEKPGDDDDVPQTDQIFKPGRFSRSPAASRSRGQAETLGSQDVSLATVEIID